MKNIAATGRLGHGPFLAGAKAGAEIGDRSLGSETAILTFEQAEGPGVGVALVFDAQQKAVGGPDVGANQNGSALLEDFVEAGDVHVGEILTAVVGTCLIDGVEDDVMHGANRHVNPDEPPPKLV